MTIAGVTDYKITVGCSLVLESGYSFETIKPNLVIAINNFFKTLNRNWANSDFITVRLAQITTVLLDVDGVIDVASCQLNGKARNIELSQDEIPTLQNIVEI